MWQTLKLVKLRSELIFVYKQKEVFIAKFDITIRNYTSNFIDCQGELRKKSKWNRVNCRNKN